MVETKTYEVVIAQILQDLDIQHATYQSLYVKYHGCEDLEAKHSHYMLVELCKKFRREMVMREGS